MGKKRRLHGLALLMFLLLFFSYAHGAAPGGIPVGTTLPAFEIPGPSDKADQEYLGLKGVAPFTLSQVSGKLVVIEFLSVL